MSFHFLTHAVKLPTRRGPIHLALQRVRAPAEKRMLFLNLNVTLPFDFIFISFRQVLHF